MRRAGCGSKQWGRSSTRVRAVFSLAIVLWIPASVHAEGEDPTPLQKYVDFDQNYNVLRRKRTADRAEINTFTPEQKAERELAYFKVSRGNPMVQFLSSSSLTPAEMAALVHRDASGKTFYLLPILKKDKAIFRLCQTFLGKPLTVTAAKKLLGRTTHAVFANDVISEDFFIKWVTPSVFENVHARRALMTNEYIESGNDLLPPDLRDHLINDVAQIEVRIGASRFSIGFRSTRKITKPLRGGTVYPGHGLLGCDECVAKLAAAKGLTVRKWKRNVFLPKLAEITAYSHFVLGAFYETHTQNLLIEVDEKTGDVLKLYIRDLSDVVVDPMIRLARGDARFATTEGVKTLPLIAHHLFADPNVQEAREVGMNTATYTLQSVGSHVSGFQARSRDSILFLKYYRENYARIFGKAPEISPKVQAMIAEQEKLIAESKARNLAKRTSAEVAAVPEDVAEDLAEAAAEEEVEEISRGKLRKQMVAEGIQEVFDQGKRELTTDLARKIEIGENQKVLRERFGRGLLKQEITFASEKAYRQIMPKAYQDWRKAHARYLGGLKPRVGTILDQLTFGELPEGQVAAFDRETGELLGITLYNVKPYGWAERWKCLIWLR